MWGASGLLGVTGWFPFSRCDGHSLRSSSLPNDFYPQSIRSIASSGSLQQPPRFQEDVEAHVGRGVGPDQRGGGCAGARLVSSSLPSARASVALRLCFDAVYRRFSGVNDADDIDGSGFAATAAEYDDNSSSSSIGDDAEIDFSPLDALASVNGGEAWQ